jgi:hypothetical protein
MEYTRDTQCDRCHLWFDKTDLNVVGAGDGLTLCTRCVEALWPSDEYPEDEDYSRRVTHEGQFEDEPCEGAVQVAEHPNALATRTVAGLRVEACHMPLTDLFGVAVTLDGKQAWASTSPEALWDAFNHPALYLGPEQCAKIGLR